MAHENVSSFQYLGSVDVLQKIPWVDVGYDLTLKCVACS